MPVPGTVLAGDLITFTLATATRDSVLLTAPEGAVARVPLSAAPDANIVDGVYTYVVPSPVPSSVAFTWTTAQRGTLCWQILRGAHPTTPVDVVSVTPYGFDVWPKVVPSMTTTVAECYIQGGVQQGSGSAVITQPSGWASKNNGAQRKGYMAAKGSQAAAGASGTVSFASTQTSTDGRAWQMAIRPASAVVAPSATNIVNTGKSTSTSISVKVKVLNTTTARLRVGTNTGVTTGVVFGAPTAPDADGYVHLTCTGLSPLTQYYYALELTGASVITTAMLGKSKTRPTDGAPTSFTIGFGSCNDFVTGNMSVSLTAFTNLNTRNPDVFVHTGDITYADNESSSQAAQRADLELSFGFSTTFRSAFTGRESMCIASDHDSGKNNAFPGAYTTPIRNARKQVLSVPDCPDPNGLYGSDVYGRVRLIYLDTRNFAVANTTRLGTAQKAWLANELAQPEQLKIVFMDSTWVDHRANAGDDKWASFPAEHTEVGNMIADAVGYAFVAHGDSHSLMADNGSHNSWGGFPTVCAAPLYNNSSIKLNALGDMSQGVYPAEEGIQTSQYGWLAITDNGGDITIQFNGYDSTNVSRVAMTMTAPEIVSDDHAGTKAITSTGTLTLAGKPNFTAPLAMGAGAALNFVGIPKPGGALDITASGGMTMADTTFGGTLALTASGTLLLTGKLSVPGNLFMVGTGTLGLNGTPAARGTANIVASGGMNRAIIPKLKGALARGATGSLSFTGGMASDKGLAGYVDGVRKDVTVVLRIDGVNHPVTLMARVNGVDHALPQ